MSSLWRKQPSKTAATGSAPARTGQIWRFRFLGLSRVEPRQVGRKLVEGESEARDCQVHGQAGAYEYGGGHDHGVRQAHSHQDQQSRSAAGVSSDMEAAPENHREVSTSFESQLGPKFEKRTTKQETARLVTNSLLTGTGPPCGPSPSFLGVGFSSVDSCPPSVADQPHQAPRLWRQRFIRARKAWLSSASMPSVASILAGKASDSSCS